MRLVVTKGFFKNKEVEYVEDYPWDKSKITIRLLERARNGTNRYSGMPMFIESGTFHQILKSSVDIPASITKTENFVKKLNGSILGFKLRSKLKPTKSEQKEILETIDV